MKRMKKMKLVEIISTIKRIKTKPFDPWRFSFGKIIIWMFCDSAGQIGQAFSVQGKNPESGDIVPGHGDEIWKPAESIQLLAIDQWGFHVEYLGPTRHARVRYENRHKMDMQFEQIARKSRCDIENHFSMWDIINRKFDSTEHYSGKREHYWNGGRKFRHNRSQFHGVRRDTRKAM